MSRFNDSWGKTKILLSQLLCIGAVFTACTDDEVINQTDKAPLQVSVNTSLAKQSRAIVHGEWLPSGSTIGVSLFDTEGDDYDGQGYYNIQYKATGAEEDQVCSSMGVTPAVSANEAILVAYHPYNDDEDLDITAIPVEIASQTDYMYSGPVTGITNAAPKADIVLDHALTAIRVKLVLGDFTGDASVSEIAVASPALASSATLNAADGSLDNIAGQGDKFALPVDFGLVAGGTDNDIMFVPNASVESGVTIVSATIGGKKYTAGIEFDEAYKQGYIYTYTLTLNNSGFTVTKVNVNPWETGTDDSAVLQPVKTYASDEYVVKIITNYEERGEECSLLDEDGIVNNNNSQSTLSRNANIIEFHHNVYGFIGTIDWGDGTTDTYTEVTNYPSHDYPNDGAEYIISAKGNINGLHAYNSVFQQCLKEIIHLGDCKIVYMYDAFLNCEKLQTIPVGLFDKCTEVTEFNSTFAYCTSLTSIPEGLFDHCTEVTRFERTFSSCASLQTIPEGLFKNNTKVTSFEGVFEGTSIKELPSNTFCTEVEECNFKNIFQYSSLESVKANAFDCPNLTSMDEVFRYCQNLININSNTFNCPNLSTMRYIFSYCLNLTNIPAGLFDNNRKVTNFGYMFEGCKKLTGESPYTIINVDGVDTKVHLYERNNYPEYFERIWYGDGCFVGCTNLTDYSSIPTDWKSY